MEQTWGRRVEKITTRREQQKPGENRRIRREIRRYEGEKRRGRRKRRR